MCSIKNVVWLYFKKKFIIFVVDSFLKQINFEIQQKGEITRYLWVNIRTSIFVWDILLLQCSAKYFVKNQKWTQYRGTSILCAPCSWSLFFRTIIPKECSTLALFMYGGLSKTTVVQSRQPTCVLGKGHQPCKI